MIGAGFLNLPKWQGKLQKLLMELQRQDLLRLPVLGLESVEPPWSALDFEDFFSAVSTGILFDADHRVSRFTQRLITADAEVAINRLTSGLWQNTYFKAACGSSFPFLKILSGENEVESPDKIYVQNDAVSGFVLARMENDFCSLDKAVAQAQWQKIAPSNPNLHLHGIVTRNRLALQIAEIFRKIIPAENIPIRGIGSLALEDVKIAVSMGCSLRLLGLAEKTETGIKACVVPCLIPQKFFLAQARGGSEIIYATGKSGRSHVFAYPGTNEDALVRGILADLAEINTSKKEILISERVETFCDRYYIRLELMHLGNTLSQVLRVFSEAGIEVEKVVQPEIEVSRETTDRRTVILFTAPTEPQKLKDSLEKIAAQIKLASVCSHFCVIR